MLLLFFKFTIPVDIAKERLKLLPIIVANDAIEMLPLVERKQLQIYQNNQRSNSFAKPLTHKFSFINLCNKMIFNFIDFI